jgi:hypothetical protein
MEDNMFSPAPIDPVASDTRLNHIAYYRALTDRKVSPISSMMINVVNKIENAREFKWHILPKSEFLQREK